MSTIATPSTRDRAGFAPIENYGAIGDGASVALVACDGRIDWLAVGDIAQPPVFASLLDPQGGCFLVEPEGPFTSEQRYVPRTNVLETTFTTHEGELTVLDSLNSPGDSLLNWTELVRRVYCRRGTVAVRWRVSPRSVDDESPFTMERHGDSIVARRSHLQLGLTAWGFGALQHDGRDIWARQVLAEGDSGGIVLTGAIGSALPLPERTEVEHRLNSTIDRWRAWLDAGSYPERWGDAQRRSALALRLLVVTHSGAIAAAPTTSLPERVGGDKNWDYRYCWIRDTAFTLDVLLRLGYRAEVHAAFGWMMGASHRTAPRLPVLYTLSGEVPDDHEETPSLTGYRGSKPVRFGNAAAGQLQLGTYGDFFETAFLYAAQGNVFDGETAATIARIADEVCHLWHEKDSGIWEIRGARRHYTASKMGCWAALERAERLVKAGFIDGDVDSWRDERDQIRSFVDDRCWSEESGSYTMYPGSSELDAAVLRAVPWGYYSDKTRLRGTIRAIKEELSAGPLIYRYTGMQQEEGCFVACSFWLVHALVEVGEVEEAETLLDQLVDLATPLGLYAEQIDPTSGQMLGNFPQALSHLALISAAHRVTQAHGESGSGRREM